MMTSRSTTLHHFPTARRNSAPSSTTNLDAIRFVQSQGDRGGELLLDVASHTAVFRTDQLVRHFYGPPSRPQGWQLVFEANRTKLEFGATQLPSESEFTWMMTLSTLKKIGPRVDVHVEQGVGAIRIRWETC